MERPELADEALARRAEQIAEQIALRAGVYDTAADRRRRKLVARVVATEGGRDFLMDLTDQVLRAPSPAKAALLLRRLVHSYPVARALGLANAAAFQLAALAAPVQPGLVVPAVRGRLRQELAALVVPAEPRRLSRHIARRRAQGVDLNINLLGEAVLGDDEAFSRTMQVCALLSRPDVNYVSVKISSICAQLDVLSYEESLRRIRERLRTVLREAGRHQPAKFVNLDMEEYRDLWLTLDAFTSVLDETEFARLDAGIVLQAYLPDSHEALRRLTEWARRRHREYGSGIKVRLVKGANLAMERVEAELRGWPQAPYPAKDLVDASYKRLLLAAIAPENAGAVRVGVASHNLFDIGWAMALKEAHPDGVELGIEMLEGMANPQAMAVRELSGALLLYTPVVRRRDFSSAVAYLVRRFDENTSPENFLAQLFDLAPGSRRWDEQRDRFRRALSGATILNETVRRAQDRRGQEKRHVSPASVAAELAQDGFHNAADTDFTRAANRLWASDHLERWRSSAPKLVPAIVAGEVVEEPLSGVGRDPSRPDEESYRYVEADRALLGRALAVARAAADGWAARPAAERRALLWAAAEVMEAQRGQTVAAMAFDAGKVVHESDPEVSEAVDFARYYGDRALDLDAAEGGRFYPYRTVVVAPPWNFPYAIPAGGLFAALAAGSAVILKPAPESVLTAWVLVRQCHEAGIPSEVLQFLPCADGDVGQALVTHPDVDAVVLTGSFETGRRFIGWRPDLNLHAETSGKNAIVISGSADIDDAIADLAHSAFSHSGQKCSAASLGIVEADLYDDPRFLDRLAGAVNSLRVGPADDLATQVGPLIRPPDSRLQRFLTTLAAGESWLVRPTQVGDNPQLWRPGVKLGVAPGSEMHLEECFGPVLGLMRYKSLEEAIALQNTPSYGLTGGVHTLDDAEAHQWSEEVEVGNAYVNRHITGAIVRRQPFGGWKRSCLGHRAKAGGPNYVASLGTWRSQGPVDVGRELTRAAVLWAQLARGVDESGLVAEANVWRLRPVRQAVVRIEHALSPDELRFCLGVAAIVGTHVSLSVADPGLAGGRAALVETGEAFVARVAATLLQRVRYLGPPGLLSAQLMDAGPEVVIEPVVMMAERELLCWSREQTLSWSRHRHGNVRARSGPTALPRPYAGVVNA